MTEKIGNTKTLSRTGPKVPIKKKKIYEKHNNGQKQCESKENERLNLAKIMSKLCQNYVKIMSKLCQNYVTKLY